MPCTQGSPEGYAFTFREDGWFNMTKAAKHFGKQLQNFWNSPATDEYMDEMGKVFSLESNDKGRLVYVQRGNGLLPSVGTWAHPKLAVFFARWLDVRFAVWCDSVIDDILRGKAEVTITKPQESAALALPQDYSTALRALADAVEKQQEAEQAAQQAIAKAAQMEPRALGFDTLASRKQSLHKVWGRRIHGPS